MFVRISRRISTFCQRDITLQMLKTKCIRILSYGFEACPVTKSQLSSINLAINGSYERYKLVIWILLITVDWFVSIYLVLRWSVALKNSRAGSVSVKTLQLNMQWVFNVLCCTSYSSARLSSYVYFCTALFCCATNTMVNKGLYVIYIIIIRPRRSR